jgi:hypothetical protein
MNHEFWRLLLVFVAITAFFRWSGGGRSWRRRWDRLPGERAGNRDELNALENRLSLVERLENRIDELENRLDFTERLISNRHSQQPHPQS